MRTLAAVAAALALIPAAEAREVAGVQVAETASLAGKELQLNGAGLRKKLFFKVYVGALYVEARAADPEAVVAADAPRLVRLQMLREMDREAILKAFREGIERNSRAGAAAALAQLAQVEKVIPAEVKPGQVVTVAYAPGAGTTLGVEGGPSATVAGKSFADAMLRIWLGAEPADEELKQALLGR